MSRFQDGDRVMVDTVGGRWFGTVQFGPFRSPVSDAAYLVKRATDGAHFLVIDSDMTLLTSFKVGDQAIWDGAGRVEIISGPYLSEWVRWFVVRTEAGHEDQAYERHLRPAPAEKPCTFTYKGVEYEIGTLYRDSEGDYLEFSDESGAIQFRYRLGPAPDSWTGKWRDSLAEAVDNYGPLRKYVEGEESA